MKLLTAFVLAVGLLIPPTGMAAGACRPYPVTWYSPTGVVGCVVYGEGTASVWSGPGAARNDCEWPWTDCQTITITSHQTGLTITVTPVMFCDCYTGTSDQRIVDLDPSMVAALGLDPAQGLYPVTVEPTAGTLPSMGEAGGARASSSAPATMSDTRVR